MVIATGSALTESSSDQEQKRLIEGSGAATPLNGTTQPSVGTKESLPLSLSHDLVANGAPRAVIGPLGATELVVQHPSQRLVTALASGEPNLAQANTINALDAPAPVLPKVTAPTFIDSLRALPGTVISGVLNFVASALAPLIGPGAPLDNPSLWGALVLFRRQVDQAYANHTPTLNPMQTGQDLDDGQVHGTFGGTDADGDTLVYSVPVTGEGAPAHGDVAINQAAGTWTYTPDIGYVGHDYFFVSTTDATGAAHIHALGQTHAVAARVEVTISSAVVSPPSVPDPQHPYTPDPLQPGDPVGTVRGTVNANDPQGLPITYSYTGPATTTDGSTVTVNSNGSFAYTPSGTARHNAAVDNAATSGLDTFTFTVTVTNSSGASATVPINVVVIPANHAPTPPTTQPVSTVNSGDGAVSSAVGYTDLDHDVLVYTGPAGGRTTGGGTVTVNPTTGAYTYTPEPADRLNAHTHPAQNTDTFDITIADGHGSTQTVTVSVPIDPASVITTMVELPGTYSSAPTFGPDGTIYQTSYREVYGTGWRTFITVIKPSDPQHPATIETAGLPAGGADTVAFASNGTAYVSTYATSGTDDETHVIAIDPTDPTNHVIIDVPGQPYSGNSDELTAGPGGKMYVTTYTSDSDSAITHVTVIDPTDYLNPTTTDISGVPAGPVVIGPGGHVYQTTFTNAYPTLTTHVAIIDPANPDHPTIVDLDGEPIANFENSGVVIGSDGTVYQTTTFVNGSNTQVAVFNTADPQNPFIVDVYGFPPYDIPGVAAGPANIVYQITQSGYGTQYTTYVTVIDPAGPESAVSVPIDGVTYDNVFVGPDGTAYAVTYSFSQGSLLAIINPADPQNPAIIEIPGLAVNGSSSLVTTNDGSVYLYTYDYGDSGSPDIAHFIAVDPSDPQSPKVVDLPGQRVDRGIAVAANGKIYVTTTAGSGYQTQLTVFDPQDLDHPTVVVLDGTSQHGVVFGPDNTVYQPVRGALHIISLADEPVDSSEV